MANDSKSTFCTFDGCDRPRRARMLCSTHYNQQHQPQRHRKVAMTCATCDVPMEKEVANTRDARFCTLSCRDTWRIANGIAMPPGRTYCALPKGHPAIPKPIKVDLRSDLRRAHEDSDHASVIEAVRKRTIETPAGCWEWQGRTREGYAHAKIGKRDVPVHRIVLEAKERGPLGKQAAHHTCANTVCVNPDHMVPVTAAANTAEMLARTYMVDRIRVLEAALAAIDPHHPTLAEVSLKAA